jgi:putative tryptophan/tyrosine transport system substrate-binding protein
MIARRAFITLLSGAAASWPLSARAQQSAVPVVGIIRTGLPETEPGSRMIAFRQGLNESGYVEGQNVTQEVSKTRSTSMSEVQDCARRH